jgi:hypothetical protein
LRASTAAAAMIAAVVVATVVLLILGVIVEEDDDDSAVAMVAMVVVELFDEMGGGGGAADAADDDDADDAAAAAAAIADDAKAEAEDAGNVDNGILLDLMTFAIGIGSNCCCCCFGTVVVVGRDVMLHAPCGTDLDFGSHGWSAHRHGLLLSSMGLHTISTWSAHAKCRGHEVESSDKVLHVDAS